MLSVFWQGIKIPSRSQQKKSIKLSRKAAAVNQHLISTFHRENRIIQLVDKRIKGIKHQVVVSKIKQWKPN